MSSRLSPSTVHVYIVYSLISSFLCDFSVYVLCTVTLRNKYQQSTTQNTKDWATWTPLKTGGELIIQCNHYFLHDSCAVPWTPLKTGGELIIQCNHYFLHDSCAVPWTPLKTGGELIIQCNHYFLRDSCAVECKIIKENIHRK